MKSEWKEFRLGDITEWASGGTPSKQNADFWNGTIPWISASSMGSNRYNESDLKITQEGLKAGSRLAKKDSILLLVRGSTLHQRIPVGIATSDVSFNQDVKAIKAKREFIDPWYLLFWFMAKEKDLLNMVENTGIGAGKLDTNRLQNLLIRIPPDSERDKILLFAKALDDKLLLNHQINQTLESMAQTIFKSWFVDFEPVKAKIAAIEAGEDAEGVTRAAMSAISGKTDEELDQMQAEQPECYIQLKTTTELFPTTMQDSELGEVPEGWEVKKLSDICIKVIDGTHDSPKPSEDGYYLVTGKNIVNGFIDFSKCYKISQEDHKKVIQRSKPEKGDIIFSNIGTLGSTVLVDQNFEFSIKNVALFKPLEDIYSRYLYLHFSSAQTQKLLIQKATGTTQIFFSLKFLRDLELITPPKYIISKFDEIVQPFFEERSLINQANQNLCGLRDSLLPKLLSGEIEINAVNEAES